MMELNTTRRSILVFATAMAMMSAGASTARAAPPTAQQSIRSIMTQMMQAANAHDTDRFMAGFLRSPSLVFATNGVVLHGWNALYAQQLKWWHHGKSDVHYSQKGPTEFMALAPDVEITTQRLYSRRTLPNHKVSTSAFVVTSVWRRLPQGWRILYGHESWAKPPP
jgi:ketosteroid isomerase-like protein